MKNKALIGLIANTTIGTAIAIPAVINNQTTPHIVNKVLMVNNNTNNSITNEAVVINGNSNMNLYALSNGIGIVSKLSTGEMLTILKRPQNGYCKVKVQETGAVGYINTANMKNILNGTNDSFITLSKNGQIINVSSNVRLRSNPSINANIIGHLTNNTPLNILGKQGQWYKINVNGQTGFVYEEYIHISINANSLPNINNRNKYNSTKNTTNSNINTTSNTSNNIQPASSKNNVKEINKYEYIATDCNNVPIMSEASTSSSVLDRLVSQSKIYVYSESNGWDYVNYNGIKGYIFGEEIQPMQVANSHSNIPILVYRTGYVPSSFKNGVIVEKRANTHSGEVVKLYPGDSFYVFMECDGWASVKVGSQHGFLKTSEITYAAPTSV